MNDHVIADETMDSPVGTYRIEYVADEDTEQPYNEGFGLLRLGSREYVNLNTGTLPGDGGRWGYTPRWLISSAMTAQHDVDRRSGAAVVRYLRLLGVRGVTLIDDQFYRVDATADRDERIQGIAWAPDDVPAERADQYVADSLRDWRAWGEGDVFGYRVLAPNGDEIDAVWGYYGFSYSEEYVSEEARDAVVHDVARRMNAANLVGAGFVGIV